MNEIERCKKDYKGNHCWSSIGIIKEKGEILQVFKCSQCSKCFTEKLEPLLMKEQPSLPSKTKNALGDLNE